jgi:hypothetical protein
LARVGAADERADLATALAAVFRDADQGAGGDSRYAFEYLISVGALR